MADKIVQIMQYQGISVGNEPLNDNLIPQNALTADTASIAQTAVIAQYADADTSKGTIEERLSSVEKVEGEMTFSITPSSVQINKLIKSGGICIFD